MAETLNTVEAGQVYELRGPLKKELIKISELVNDLIKTQEFGPKDLASSQVNNIKASINKCLGIMEGNYSTLLYRGNKDYIKGLFMELSKEVEKTQRNHSN